MTTILIADACKPSLVMTSEVFKDKILGTVVEVATTGKGALEYLQSKKPDLCVVDFDLPDVDGPALVEAMRQFYDGPILLTAFPGDMVQQAVEEHLFAFNDASAWISKPVNFENLAEKIDRFLLAKHRLEKRFDANFPSQLIAKAAGRGKRAPKVTGNIINISFSGACVKVSSALKAKKSQELTLCMQFPATADEAGKKKKKTTDDAGAETKIKATIAWMTNDGEIGLQFGKLTDLQKKQLETYFRSQLQTEPVPAKSSKSPTQKEARA